MIDGTYHRDPQAHTCGFCPFQDRRLGLFAVCSCFVILCLLVLGDC